jgi:hypothetical protein
MEAGYLLKLAFAPAFALRGAKTGQGDGDEEGLGEGPEGGKPKDPRAALGRRAAIASEDDGPGEGKRQSNDKGSRDSPGVVESGHNSIRGEGNGLPYVAKQGFEAKYRGMPLGSDRKIHRASA